MIGLFGYEFANGTELFVRKTNMHRKRPDFMLYHTHRGMANIAVFMQEHLKQPKKKKIRLIFPAMQKVYNRYRHYKIFLAPFFRNFRVLVRRVVDQILNILVFIITALRTVQ